MTLTPTVPQWKSRTSSIENVDETPKSSTSNNIDNIIESVIAQNIDYNDDETDFLEQHIETNLMWGPVTGNYLKNISLTLNDSGIHSHIYDLYQKTPYDFYKMMITNEIFQLFINEMNVYAQQEKNKNTTRRSRIQNWKDTTQEEMEKFIGCLMWMGLLQSIRDYWSKKSLYENSLKNVLPRNRFQILLKTWLFANNENANTDDRLNKISQLLTKLQQSFQAPIIPGEFICIDETLVPFKVYCGQERDPAEEHTVPSQVVLNLTKNLLNSGRTIVVDNYYTSVELAHKLLETNTYIIGTLRSNRKCNPKNILQKKLKLGQTIAEESNTGVFVEK
ncbi:hypothetical protein NQ314_005216 [Rhamnusium bicolor]|uniref:PiggyBac transposable element-derived protein domain-containing protein n=1 Tax=Rhamnusium bicolor TaxID=1586634 RepID=A0AAV8ZK14_9CUCU|nr:hypothetical protein NQ314_005216 [Rhamnusium bicolor]